MTGFQYTNNVLDFFPHSEGYAKAIASSMGGGSSYDFKYVFTYTDHLGNIRLKYAQDPSKNNEISILEEDHYYPYGLKHSGYNTFHQIFTNDDEKGPGTGIVLTPVNPFLGDSYKYKFGGKEYQTEFDINTYDFGARNYDPALGRWMNVDPLAEEMPSWSPYNYTFNNPIRFTDPTGMAPLAIIPRTRPIPPVDFKRVAKGILKLGRDAENYIKTNGRGFRIWANGDASVSTSTDGNSDGPSIDLSDVPTLIGPRRSTRTTKSFANNFGEGAEAGQRVDDAVESVNKLMEGADALNKKESNVNGQEDEAAYLFDFWKDGGAHGGGDGAIGKEAAIKRKNELQKDYPDLDITIRNIEEPHPLNKNYKPE